MNNRKSEIVYNKMGGRPSLKLRINEKWLDCLLDTGARINVIDEEVVNKLKNVKIKIAEDRIACANGSKLKTKGRAILNIEIDGVMK